MSFLNDFLYVSKSYPRHHLPIRLILFFTHFSGLQRYKGQLYSEGLFAGQLTTKERHWGVLAAWIILKRVIALDGESEQEGKKSSSLRYEALCVGNPNAVIRWGETY